MLRSLTALGASLVIVLSASPAAQRGDNPAPQRPQLSAERQKTSRALRNATAMARLSPRASLWDVPKDIDITIDVGAAIDPNAARTAAEEVSRATCSSSAVIVGVPQRLESFLNEEGDFLLTEYAVKVVELIRGNGPAKGSTPIYVRPGGSASIRGQLVRTAHNMYPPLMDGATYVFFLSPIEGAQNSFRFPESTTGYRLDVLRVDPTGVARSATRNYPPSLVAGLAEGQVRDSVRAASCK